jgi:chromosome segregation ATPase
MKTYEDLYREYNALQHELDKVCEERDEARGKLLSCQRAREEAERDRDNAEARVEVVLKMIPVVWNEMIDDSGSYTLDGYTPGDFMARLTAKVQP